MKNTPIFIALSLFIFSCNRPVEKPPVNLIPYPNQLIEKEGVFVMDPETGISVNSDSLLQIAELFVEHYQEKLSTTLSINIANKPVQNGVNFILDKDPELSEEEYVMIISKEGAQLKASSLKGLFYGVKTLMQLVYIQGNKIILPNLEIKDAPRFAWRGMHLDVSRHFMPPSFIKKYIDILAMYKYNVFHWHLVDGIGWRIEIKSHPELTDIGAWRVVKEGRKPWQDVEAWREGDDRPKYGGYYTQEEIKDIVKYAQDRFITIVPEIELPGHSDIVFDCYPDLVCKNERGKSLNNTGVYCASNPQSYKLLEDVITEVIELFPSEYIHIGGDEVNKGNWEKCAGCQKLMKENEYSPHELQSHFVNHFDKFIRSGNRKMIGWHEIMEGNLSSASIIMYWGGINELEEKLAKGYPTVVASGTSYYFDHYQSVSVNEPEAWGGYSPLKQVYDLEPVSIEIDKKLQKQVLGIQGQIWTEHIPDPEHVEYMFLPRGLALAESAWTLPENKNWSRFSNAVVGEFNKFDELGINYSKSSFRPIIEAKVDTTTRKLKVKICSELETDIYYTIDGSEPTLENSTKYSEPFLLDSSTVISAVSVQDGEILTEFERQEAFVHKARGCKVTFRHKPHSSYSANGGKSLVDMEFGGRTWSSGKWIGILNKELDVVIDLEKQTPVSKTILSCLKDHGAFIYFPKSIEVLVSEDGNSFHSVKTWEKDTFSDDDKNLKKFTLEFEEVNCRYLRVRAQCHKLPDAGVFIFTDELIVL